MAYARFVFACKLPISYTYTVPE